MVLYSIVPWIGVMAAGYGFGAILALEPARRRRCVSRSGSAHRAVPAAPRVQPVRRPASLDAPDSADAGLLAFLNTTKYPASLSFLLMTLGPTIALVPLLERARGAPAQLARRLRARAVLLLRAAHPADSRAGAASVSSRVRAAVNPWLFANHPMGNPPPPEGYTWSLGLLYLVWRVAVLLLYFPCRWFAELKARRKDWWLSYL